VEGIYSETVPVLESGNEFWQLAIAGGGKNVHLWLHPGLKMFLEEQEKVSIEGIVVVV
jgi:hypothetical protein